MKIRCSRLFYGLLVLALVPFHSHADNETTAKQATVLIKDVLEIKAFVDANGIFCDAFSTKYSPEVQMAIADWYQDNRIHNVTNIIYGNLKKNSGGVSIESRSREKNLNELESKVRARADEWCARLGPTLKTDDMNLALSYTAKLQALNSYYNQIRAAYLEPDETIAPKSRSLTTIKSPSYQTLVSAKVDPSRTLVASEFRCYGFRPGADYNTPDFIVQLAADRTYKSTFGAGSYVGVFNDKGKWTRNLAWTGALGKFRSSWLANKSRYGQNITFKDLEVAGIKQDYTCYEQGASEREALTTFRLKEPREGDYQCRDSEGESRNSFSILKGYRYQAGLEEGAFTVDLRSSDDNDSDVRFVAGPLVGTSGRFREEAGTGRKMFTFKEVSSNFLAQSSSSRLDMTCTNVGDPIDYQVYGEESVPAPPAGSGGMAGLYAVKRKVDATKPNKFGFYLFTPEGRVFAGEPDMAVSDIKCLSTHPSGKPRCDTYRVVGDEITLNNGFKDYITLQRETLIDVPANVTRINGKYTGAIGGTSGLCVPFSTCSSWFRKSIRQFTADGRFSKNSSSLSTISSSVGVGTSHGRGSSNSSDSGRYQIEGNLIHLQYGDGVVETKFIAVLNNSVIHTDGWTYYLDDE